MTDLVNNWPAFGSSGISPSDGFTYSAQDQVYNYHMNFLWDNLEKSQDDISDAIIKRITATHGNVVLDNGLKVTAGSGRVVNISASSAGAFVNGQWTESVSGVSITLNSNSTGSTRTDTIWVSEAGQIGRSTNTTVAPSNSMKLAEADVTTSNTISDVRNYADDYMRCVSSENAPDAPATNGGLWYKNDTQTLHVYVLGNWVPIVLADGSTAVTDDINMANNSLNNVKLEGSYVKTQWYNKQEGGVVADGTFVPLGVFSVGANESLYVSHGVLTENGFGAVASGVDLIMVDDLGGVITLISGGTFAPSEELSEVYENVSGNTRTVVIGVDNGHYNAGAGFSSRVFAGFIARVQ